MPEANQRESIEKHEKEREQAKEEMHRLEEADELPERIEDWPSGKAKYETFGGPDGESGYDEGPTSKLGPSSLRHHEDGSVSIDGEMVDNPEEYKGDPIPGGPTDPNAPEDVGVTKTTLERRDEEGDAGSEGDVEPPHGGAG